MLLLYLLLLLITLLLVFLLLALRERQARSSRARNQVTPKYIESMIAYHHPNVHVKSVDILNLAQAGDGKASTTDRLSLHLTFDSNPHNIIPSNLMLKTTLLPPSMRIGGALLPRMAGAIATFLRPSGLDSLLFWCINQYNFYFPHAPDAMYINETKVYRQLHNELQSIHFNTPKIFGSEENDKERKWSLLIENLETTANFPTALEEHELRHVEMLLRSLARLHGRYWESERFQDKQDLAFIPIVHQKGNSMHQVFEALGYGLIRDHVQSNPFEQELLKPLKLSVEQLWEGVQLSKNMLATPPLTLCHGDAHIQNTYVTKDGCNVGMFDFQVTLRACWARDVSYLMGTCMTEETRRRHEDSLLKMYLGECRKEGGNPPAIFAEAKDLYAKGMAWGLVIGWLICPPNNYGKDILSANVRRLVAACVDLKTFELLLSGGSASENGSGKEL